MSVQLLPSPRTSSIARILFLPPPQWMQSTTTMMALSQYKSEGPCSRHSHLSPVKFPFHAKGSSSDLHCPSTFPSTQAVSRTQPHLDAFPLLVLFTTKCSHSCIPLTSEPKTALIILSQFKVRSKVRLRTRVKTTEVKESIATLELG